MHSKCVALSSCFLNATDAFIESQVLLKTNNLLLAGDDFYYTQSKLRMISKPANLYRPALHIFSNILYSWLAYLLWHYNNLLHRLDCMAMRDILASPK